MLGYLISGLIGAVNMVLWGVYGDLQMEKFEWKKVLRTILIAIMASVFLFVVNADLPLFVVALIVIAFERFTTEIYKAFIRKEKQDKYLIPSDLNLKWPRSIKILCGLILILGIPLIFWYYEIQLNSLFVMLIAGVAVAIGGMAKDAPYEGFQLKFFRSPIVALGVGLLIEWLYPGLGSKYLLFGVWGGERVVSEWYKKIWNGKVAGKFKPVKEVRHWKEKRWWVLIPYFADVVLLLLLAVVS